MSDEIIKSYHNYRAKNKMFGLGNTAEPDFFYF